MDATPVHTADTRCGLTRLVQRLVRLVRLVRQVTLLIAASALVLAACTATIPPPGPLAPASAVDDEAVDGPDDGRPDAQDEEPTSGSGWPSACHNAVLPIPC